MMGNQDNLSLEKTYEIATSDARQAVAGRYHLEVCSTSDKDYPSAKDWREVWKISPKGEEAWQPLLVAIPLTFPDAFPAIYLCQETANQIGHIPHIDSNRFICTFDIQSTRLNADRPVDIVLAVIEKAQAILKAGKENLNLQDYADELAAYWEDGTYIWALSLIDSQEECSEIVHYSLKPPASGATWLFAPDRDTALDWLKNTGYSGKYEKHPALYLPLQSLGNPPFPQTNAELCARLKESDSESLKKLLAFLAKEKRPSYVLFSIKTSEGTIFGAWSHPKISHQARSAKGRRIAPGNIPGFRPQKHPINLELEQYHGDALLLRARVDRIDRSRLLKRTAGSDLVELPLPINVVGCGSVGGFVAENLVRSALVRKMRLIDFEALSVENVWRHYCGMSDVGTAKVTAVARKLSRHFPDINTELYQSDILLLLKEKPQAFKEASLTLVTLGHFSTETRLNRLYFARQFADGPLCFMWVEPELYAGHAALIFPGQPGCLECMTVSENLLFQHRVIQEPGNFTKREAGCQSSFTPYGAMELVEFVTRAMRFVRTHLTQEQNTLFTWTGNLDEARNQGVVLSPEWANAKPFSERSIPITRSQHCLVCQTP